MGHFSNATKLSSNLKLILLSFFVILNHNAAARQPKSFAYPAPGEEYSLRANLGISIGKLPKSVVDDQIYQSPLAFVSARFDLPLGINIQSTARSIFLTNHFSIGSYYNHRFGRFAASVGGAFAYWFGNARFDNFDVSINGTMLYPSASVGVALGNNIFLTAQYEFAYMTSLNKSVAKINVQSRRNQVIGSAFSIIVEEPVWEDNIIQLGLKLNYTKYFYQSWLAFSNREQWYFVPEFSLGYLL